MVYVYLTYVYILVSQKSKLESLLLLIDGAKLYQRPMTIVRTWDWHEHQRKAFIGRNDTYALRYDAKCFDI